MSRPKRGTPESDKANAQWKATIIARYGSVEAFMSNVGRKGGAKGRGSKKGFAANKDLARRAGAIGGTKSRRGKELLPKIEAQHDEIKFRYLRGDTVRDIAKELDLPLPSLYRYVKQFND